MSVFNNLDTFCQQGGINNNNNIELANKLKAKYLDRFTNLGDMYYSSWALASKHASYNFFKKKYKRRKFQLQSEI